MRAQTISLLNVPYGERLKEEQLQDVLNHVFETILPEQGFVYRDNQAKLASEILHSLAGRNIALAEAGVGTGKTHAYLVAAILAKRGRLGDFWNSGYYPDMTYRELANLPIVISTSSIALQRAIIHDYIPELSNIFMKYGLIERPLTSVIRKGKEHYICEAHLRNFLAFEKDPAQKKELERLLSITATIDLSEKEGLSGFVKRKIGVTGHCSRRCEYAETCRYRIFRERAFNSGIDFQVCNHNYYLADIQRRINDESPLMPNYQAVIIDEAHKFLQAAQQMSQVELSKLLLPEIVTGLERLHFSPDDKAIVRKYAMKLFGQNRRLFKQLTQESRKDMAEEGDKVPVSLDKNSIRHLRNIQAISAELADYLKNTNVSSKDAGWKAQYMGMLKQAERQATALSKPDKLITWLEKPEIQIGGSTGTLLTGLPKNISEQLYSNIWQRGLPLVLTSGTLSAAGDFSRTKETLGLENIPYIKEISTASPFNYRENVLLYISENMPFPDMHSTEYIEAVAKEAKALLLASHGHGMVLFTSYRVMELVLEKIEPSYFSFPLFWMDKGGIKTIEMYRNSVNGVLFAAGALWEGIDLPGDILSMLIIVKLPFAVPGPLNEYEQSLYPSLEQFKQNVVVPDMLMKLKQGFGRLIRTECDTGVVAILDSRAGKFGAYRRQVLESLPSCPVTNNKVSIEKFFIMRKAQEYFSKC